MKLLIISLSLLILLTGCNKVNIEQVIINDNVFTVEIADTEKLQAQGLSGRENLATDAGMLFIFSEKKVRSFWMKDMKISIDLLWLDNDKIVGWEKNMLPPTDDAELIHYTSPQAIDRVLELPAGTINQLNLQTNDTIIYR